MLTFLLDIYSVESVNTEICVEYYYKLNNNNLNGKLFILTTTRKGNHEKDIAKCICFYNCWLRQ